MSGYTQLRPCPHCSGLGELHPQENVVRCRVCGASTRPCPTLQRATEEWNARALLCPNCGRPLDATAEAYDSLGRKMIRCTTCHTEVILGDWNV